MTSLGVRTDLVAAAVGDGALVIVEAREAVGVEGIALITAARMTSGGVGTDLRTAAVRDGTFVVVEAGLAIGVERVA